MKKDKKAPVRVAAKDAAFVYLSTCCTAAAEKPACAVPKGQNIGTFLGAKPEGEGSLGSWRCSACRKPCSVNRSNHPKPEVANV